LHWDFAPRGRAQPGCCPQGEDTAGPGKDFPAGNMRVTATAQDDDTRMADIGKLTGIDIPSGETGRAQV